MNVRLFPSVLLYALCFWICSVQAYAYSDSSLLAKGYTVQMLSLEYDFDGTPVAALISKACIHRSEAAVLYVHGYNDYFFQDHLADWYLAHGYNFYALELRRYGRALLAGQTRYDVRSLTDYYEELDAAINIIRNSDGNTSVLLNGHSTGGLILSLYVSDRSGSRTVDALYLNSPFLQLNAGWFTRNIISPVFVGLGGIFPKMKLPVASSPYYGESLHRDFYGEWNYDLALKLLQNKPRAGWFRAIRKAQKKLRKGLSVECPVLVMHSDMSGSETVWNDRIPVTDVVLNVDDIKRLSPGIGRDVTIRAIARAKHDVVLSIPAVRKNALDELEKWTGEKCANERKQ